MLPFQATTRCAAYTRSATSAAHIRLIPAVGWRPQTGFVPYLKVVAFQQGLGLLNCFVVGFTCNDLSRPRIAGALYRVDEIFSHHFDHHCFTAWEAGCRAFMTVECQAPWRARPCVRPSSATLAPATLGGSPWLAARGVCRHRDAARRGQPRRMGARKRFSDITSSAPPECPSQRAQTRAFFSRRGI
jgi:hypothetical protein